MITNNETMTTKNIEYGVFVKYYDGYYKFIMDNGEIIVFEAISQLADRKFNLKANIFIGKSFEITYSFQVEDDDEDFIVYKIDKLEFA